MDERTSAFYDAYAAALTLGTEASRSAMLSFVKGSFPAGASVLDVGAGSGRDVSAMLTLGLDAWGVEPNARMREKAVAMRSELAGRLRAAVLPQLDQPFADVHPDGFDGVVCSAVLMHLNPDELLQALASLVRQLRPFRIDAAPDAQPALLLSFPAMAPEMLREHRDPDQRRFHNHDLTIVEHALNRHGLAVVTESTSKAALAATGTVWHSLVYRRIR